MKTINNIFLIMLLAFWASCGAADDPSDDPSSRTDTCGNGYSASFELHVTDGASYEMLFNEKTTFSMTEATNPSTGESHVTMSGIWYPDVNSETDYFSLVGMFLENFDVGTYEINSEDEDERLQLLRITPEGNFSYKSTMLNLEITEIERGLVGFFDPIIASFSGTFEYSHDGVVEIVEVTGSFCLHEFYPR